MLVDEAVERSPAEDQRLDRPEGGRGRRPRSSVEEGELAEEPARSDRRQDRRLRPVLGRHGDLDRAIRDDVQRITRVVLVEDDFAALVPPRAQRRREQVQRRRRRGQRTAGRQPERLERELSPSSRCADHGRIVRGRDRRRSEAVVRRRAEHRGRSAAGDRAHRVDADDDRGPRIERQLVADLAGLEQLTQQPAFAIRQADVDPARSRRTGVTSSSSPSMPKRRRSSCIGTYGRLLMNRRSCGAVHCPFRSGPWHGAPLGSVAASRSSEPDACPVSGGSAPTVEAPGAAGLPWGRGSRDRSGRRAAWPVWPDGATWRRSSRPTPAGRSARCGRLGLTGSGPVPVEVLPWRDRGRRRGVRSDRTRRACPGSRPRCDADRRRDRRCCGADVRDGGGSSAAKVVGSVPGGSLRPLGGWARWWSSRSRLTQAGRIGRDPSFDDTAGCRTRSRHAGRGSGRPQPSTTYSSRGASLRAIGPSGPHTTMSSIRAPYSPTR